MKYKSNNTTTRLIILYNKETTIKIAIEKNL